MENKMAQPTNSTITLPMLRQNDGIISPQLQTNVQKLQQALGYQPNQIDGKFGSGTEQAVKLFQKKMDS